MVDPHAVHALLDRVEVAHLLAVDVDHHARVPGVRVLVVAAHAFSVEDAISVSRACVHSVAPACLPLLITARVELEAPKADISPRRDGDDLVAALGQLDGQAACNHIARAPSWFPCAECTLAPHSGVGPCCQSARRCPPSAPRPAPLTHDVAQASRLAPGRHLRAPGRACPTGKRIQPARSRMAATKCGGKRGAAAEGRRGPGRP